MSQTKRNALILLALAGVIVIILAMSIPKLVLTPGEPFSLGDSQAPTVGTNPPLTSDDLLVWVFRGGVALVIVLLPFYIGYSLLSAKGRRRLLGNAALFVLMFLIADYLQKHPLSAPTQQQEAPPVEQGNQALQNGLPTSVFTPDPPAWLTVAVILIASILVVLTVVAVIWYIRQRRQPEESGLEKLAETAQSAIESIQSGEDFELSVIRCYQEMSRVVKQQRGITLETTMTPREFEDRLVSRGLPQDAIRTLTRLFEQVRYGGKLSGTGDEMMALNCLTDIVKACGGKQQYAVN